VVCSPRRKSIVRAECAEKSIPDFVQELLDGVRELTPAAVRVLYCEYRALFGSPSSFPMHFENVTDEPDTGECMDSLLAGLRRPFSMSRLKTRKKLATLNVYVRDAVCV
jgi:hypothetical protein